MTGDIREGEGKNKEIFPKVFAHFDHISRAYGLPKKRWKFLSSLFYMLGIWTNLGSDDA
jgi:hypothetical protein